VLEKNDIDLLITETTDIDREGKFLHTKAGEIGYERLILATGSRPAMPPTPGFELEGVFTIVKDVEYLSELDQWLQAAKDVAVMSLLRANRVVFEPDGLTQCCKSKATQIPRVALLLLRSLFVKMVSQLLTRF
jgi:hypothetical protein